MLNEVTEVHEYAGFLYDVTCYPDGTISVLASAGQPNNAFKQKHTSAARETWLRDRGLWCWFR